MFKFFRRSSKVPVDGHDKAPDPRQKSLSTHPPKTTFFSLPAELRNAIYELATKDITLTVDLDRSSSQKPTKKTTKPTIPSLLLTSRQTRTESLPILLSQAQINLPVTDFNFAPIIRLSGSLYSTERKALAFNDSLVIRLHFTTGGWTDMQANLRRWGSHRAASVDRLPWTYRLGCEPQERLFAWSYEQCVGRLCSAEAIADEATAWELIAILDDVSMGELDAVPGLEGI